MDKLRKWFYTYYWEQYKSYRNSSTCKLPHHSCLKLNSSQRCNHLSTSSANDQSFDLTMYQTNISLVWTKAAYLIQFSLGMYCLHYKDVYKTTMKKIQSPWKVKGMQAMLQPVSTDLTIRLNTTVVAFERLSVQPQTYYWYIHDATAGRVALHQKYLL